MKRPSPLLEKRTAFQVLIMVRFGQAGSRLGVGGLLSGGLSRCRRLPGASEHAQASRPHLLPAVFDPENALSSLFVGRHAQRIRGKQCPPHWRANQHPAAFQIGIPEASSLPISCLANYRGHTRSLGVALWPNDAAPSSAVGHLPMCCCISLHTISNSIIINNVF